MNKKNKYIITVLIILFLSVTVLDSFFNKHNQVKADSNQNDIYDVVLF